MPSTKHIWNQSDRDTPQQSERRTILQALATVEALHHVVDEGLDAVWKRPPAVLQRVGHTLQDAISAARTLLEAYDYYQSRCAEAGITPEDAAAAWDLHSSEAFEQELVEAEAYGPNALRMVDATILAVLQIPPHDAPEGSDAPC